MRRSWMLPACLILATLPATMARAEPPPDLAIEEDEDDDAWRFAVTPYFWFPAMKGTSTVNGNTVAIDLSFSEVWNTFDVFALAMRVEAWKSRLLILLDGYWVDLSTRKTLPLPAAGRTKAESGLGIVDMGVGYRVVDIPVSLCECLGDDSRFMADLMTGLRYTHLKQQLKNLPLGLGNAGGTENYAEFFLGGRLGLQLTNRLSLATRGTISGGFGFGHVSNLTWDFLAGFGYRYTDSWALKLGYKIYDIDYSRGTGASRFAMDWRLQGIWLGFTWYPGGRSVNGIF